MKEIGSVIESYTKWEFARSNVVFEHIDLFARHWQIVLRNNTEMSASKSIQLDLN